MRPIFGGVLERGSGRPKRSGWHGGFPRTTSAFDGCAEVVKTKGAAVTKKEAATYVAGDV